MSGSAEQKFQDFVAARTPALTRTAFLLTGDHQLAEDLVQTTLFKTAKAWQRIVGAPEPYARRVMYHESVSWWRRRRHVVELLAEHVPERSQTAVDSTTAVVLRQALARLTPKQRTILVLRYFEDMSESQVAEAMGVALGTVKSQTRHALARLRELAPELVDLEEGAR